jgi:small-conductance mechanosensitive channel
MAIGNSKLCRGDAVQVWPLLLLFLWNCTTTNVSALPENPVSEGFTKMTESIHDTFDDVFESLDDILEQSTLAGQITPLVQKFFLSKAQLRAIWSGIRQAAQFSDILFLVLLGWVLVPAVELTNQRMVVPTTRTTTRSHQNHHQQASFRSTKTYHVVHTLSQIAKLAMLVYLVDMIKIFLLGAGFQIPRHDHLTHAFSYILYTAWATLRLSALKRYMLCQMTGEEEGRLQVVNRLLDAILFLVGGFLILDILSLEMGLAMRGAMAFGSVGTLVFSLASKDIVSNLLQGIVLSASDRLYEGDNVRLLNSGFSGTVAKLGWLETVLRGSDDIMVTINNAELLSLQVCNLSRIQECQVTQILRFPYSDSEKLPQLLKDIKTEIRANCPAIITDGSRPFRCYWTGYNSDHLEVMVDAHFRIKPVGDVYYENRQRVLQAIDRAVKKSKMEFHII